MIGAITLAVYFFSQGHPTFGSIFIGIAIANAIGFSFKMFLAGKK